MSEDQDQPPIGDDETEASPDGEDPRAGIRRGTLVRLGLYGAATAPALLTVLKANKAMAQSPIGPPIPGGPGVFG